MATQGISDKDAKLLETKPLLVIIKYLSITIATLMAVIVTMFFMWRSDLQDGKRELTQSRNETKDVTLKLVETVERGAQTKENFNQVMTLINESRNNHTDNSTNSSPNIKGK